MSKVFERRQFVPGKLVHIKLLDPKDPHGIIGSILKLVLDKRMFNIGGGSTSGRGTYIAFHEAEHAYEIERHVTQLTKSLKAKGKL